MVADIHMIGAVGVCIKFCAASGHQVLLECSEQQGNIGRLWQHKYTVEDGGVVQVVLEVEKHVVIGCCGIVGGMPRSSAFVLPVSNIVA